jgi:uncharacterized protein (TIGR02271 family)
MQMTSAYEFVGRTVVDRDGEKLGTIKEIYEDQQTGKPEWATVAGGLFGLKSHFVPLVDAAPTGEDIRLPVAKDQVQSAPSVDADGGLSEQEEQHLFEHYGVPYTTDGTTTAEGGPGMGSSEAEAGAAGTAAGGGGERGAATAARAAGAGGTSGEDAMTRSEEEVRVGTARRETGRVRLRKHVVTEQVQKTVPVQREEVRVEREPVTEENRGAAMSGPEITEGEHEVVLHEEEPVVEKRVVPKERVRLSKDTEVDERAVSEEVRKERIDVDQDH